MASSSESILKDTSTEPLMPEVAVRDRKYSRFWLTVEPIVLSVFFADTLSDSVTTNFILIRTCLNHFHYNESACYELVNQEGNRSAVEALVQPYSAIVLTGMSFLSIIFPAFLTLFAGPWSDYNGRKLLLVVPALGYSLKYIMLGLFWFIPGLGPEYGLLSVVPVTLSGGIINFVTASYAYISDVSGKEDRFLRISFLEITFGTGNFLGLFSVSYILKLGGEYGYVIVYGLSAGVVILTALHTFFFVPESVERTENGNGLLHVFDVKLLKEIYQVCFSKEENHKRAVVILVILSLTLTTGVNMGESNVFFLFTRLQFGWNIEEFTFWASISFAAFFSGGVFVSLVFTKCLKISDSVLGIISYIMKSFSHFFIGFIPSTAPHLMFYACLFSLFGGICSPINQTILSKIVPKKDLGKVFALAGTSESVLPLIMGPIYTALYGHTLKTLPGAFLILSGSIFITCSIIFIIIHCLQRRVEGEPRDESSEGE